MEVSDAKPDMPDVQLDVILLNYATLGSLCRLRRKWGGEEEEVVSMTWKQTCHYMKPRPHFLSHDQSGNTYPHKPAPLGASAALSPAPPPHQPSCGCQLPHLTPKFPPGFPAGVSIHIPPLRDPNPNNSRQL